MNNNKSPTTFESNLANLLRASRIPAESGVEDRLTRAVLDEVRRQQSARQAPWWRARAVRWTSALAAAAALLVILVSWHLLGRPVGSAGEVRSLYGMVEFNTKDLPANKEQRARTIMDQWTAIPANAQVQTRWGSQAEIRLADKSRLLSRPQTTLAIERGRRGERVILNEGWISVEAARQQPGQSLQVQTPGACISVLGTKFDVHVVQKASGRRQTRVSVASGKVAMESGGQKILLPPNTEGITEEGQPPLRRCQTPEVNELLRLSGLGQRLAREQQAASGAPSLIEFRVDGTATVWLITELKEAPQQQVGAIEIVLKSPAKDVAAYRMDGSPLVATLDVQGSRIRLAAVPASESSGGRLILRLGGLQGLFLPRGKGAFEFSRAGQAAPVLSLYQLRLPESANIEDIQPQPIETARSLSLQTITLAVRALPPDLIE